MHIAIVGAGFTGLSAGYRLLKSGHTVTLFEAESTVGGLAIGFEKKGWEWSLDKHYHHIFASDKEIQELAREIGHEFIFSRLNTSSLVEGQVYQFDSPEKVLTFDKLSYFERIRLGAVLGYLKYLSDWRGLEKYTAHQWLSQKLGEKIYAILWEHLLKGKFGNYYKEISMAWFWARIKTRTTSLGYPEGGFQSFADKLEKEIHVRGGKILLNSKVQNIDTCRIMAGGKKYEFDQVIVTVPNIIFSKLAPTIDRDYKNKLDSFEGIGAVTMILELSRPFFSTGVYWLNICDKGYPFLAVVEHTNYMDKKFYGGNHIVYVGNYLPHSHTYFSMTKEKLLEQYHPYLEKLCPGYRSNIVDVQVFRAPFAQPIVKTNFSKKILPFDTPWGNVYLANMQQVYPWDRGTNFAVEMGNRIAYYISDI